MSSRKLALVRSVEGPWVPTMHMAKPKIKVIGLSANHTIKVVQRIVEDDVTEVVQHEFSESGIFSLSRAAWTKVYCTPRCHNVICELHSGAQA